MTIARFHDIRDLRMLAAQVEALRECRLGTMKTAVTELVINDFYMSEGTVETIATIGFFQGAALLEGG